MILTTCSGVALNKIIGHACVVTGFVVSQTVLVHIDIYRLFLNSLFVLTDAVLLTVHYTVCSFSVVAFFPSKVNIPLYGYFEQKITTGHIPGAGQ